MKLYHVPVLRTEIIKVTAHTAKQATDVVEIMMIQGMHSPCPNIIDYEILMPTEEEELAKERKEICYER